MKCFQVDLRNKYIIFSNVCAMIFKLLYLVLLYHADLMNLTNKFMRDPVQILVKSEQLTLEGIKQFHIALDADGEKYETLM